MVRLLKDQSGQTATEYMLIIAGVIAALLGAAYAFVPDFQSGVEALAGNIKTYLSKGFGS